MPAGGRGYTRVPSLISVWSTAPFLLNNTVGESSPDNDPSVEARLKVFDDAIEQMLWPEKRKTDAELGAKAGGLIDRTTERSTVTVPAGFVPEAALPLQGFLHRWLPWLVKEQGDIVLGPIPKGVPVNLLANLKLRAEADGIGEKASHLQDVGELLVKLRRTLASAPPGATDEQLRMHFATVRASMLELSKCPDFVVNRGHYFGTAQFNQQDGLSADEKAFGKEPVLSDEDKRALIAFLKTF
jgi:hypothetical protein